MVPEDLKRFLIANNGHNVRLHKSVSGHVEWEFVCLHVLFLRVLSGFGELRRTVECQDGWLEGGKGALGNPKDVRLNSNQVLAELSHSSRI